MKRIKDRFRDAFDPQTYLEDLKHILARLSHQIVHDALLLYYAFRRRETPFWAKSIIIGVLGYLISPLDTIPDLTPILGYTDDFNFIILALISLGVYIDDDVKFKTEAKMSDWFGIDGGKEELIIKNEAE